MNSDSLMLFAPEASHYFAEKVAGWLGVSLAPQEERQFEDGEHKIRPLVSVRGKDVFVIQSLFSDNSQSVNDKFCRFLFFIGALRDASAYRITAVIPYLAYARKDRRSQPRDPVTSRYMAQLLESIGADRVVTMDVHNLAAFQNGFRCPSDHLEACGLFVRYLATRFQKENRVTVVSPDAGGFKRADAMRQAFERVLNRQVEMAFLEKARAKGVLRTGRMVGEVADSAVVIVDDLISTGRTLVHAAKLCKDSGAKSVCAATTHGVFVTEANQILASEQLDEILITDTIPPFRLSPQLISQKIHVLPASDIFAEAIRRIHQNQSIVELLTVP